MKADRTVRNLGIAIAVLVLGMVTTVVWALTRPDVTTRAVRAPDGYPALLLECETFGACLAHAGELCPDGYLPLNAQHQQGQAGFLQVGKLLVPLDSSSNVLLIRCAVPAALDAGTEAGK